MNKEIIIETVNRFFTSVDEGNWEEVARIFSEKVFLDYTSMSGGEPALLSSQHIISGWKNLLPGFDKTHHQLGNFVVSKNIENHISVHCYVTATHYLQNESGNNLWRVFGTYNLEIKDEKGLPKILKLKFNLKFTDGNKELPALAGQRMSDRV